MQMKTLSTEINSMKTVLHDFLQINFTIGVTKVKFLSSGLGASVPSFVGLSFCLSVCRSVKIFYKCVEYSTSESHIPVASYCHCITCFLKPSLSYHQLLTYFKVKYRLYTKMVSVFIHSLTLTS